MDIEKIAERARKSISRYCTEECKSYCCRKGYLVLNADEVDIITVGRKKELQQKGVLKKLEDGRYSLSMSDEPCASQGKRNRCVNYKLRPQMCKDFPIFIDGNNIRFSPRCLAVRNGKFYPYEDMFARAGFKLSTSDVK